MTADNLWRMKMADQASVVHIGENSPEEVAFKLLKEVAAAEGMSMYAGPGGQKPTRAWLLQTYGDCLRAVRNPTMASEGKIGNWMLTA